MINVIEKSLRLMRVSDKYIFFWQGFIMGQAVTEVREQILQDEIKN